MWCVCLKLSVEVEFAFLSFNFQKYVNSCSKLTEKPPSLSSHFVVPQMAHFYMGIIVPFLLGLCHAGAVPRYDTASIVVGQPISAPVRSDFMGFSLEYKDHLNVIGNCSSALGVKTSYMQLLNNIAEKNGPGTRGPHLRFGGNSATVCWLNPGGLPAPNPAETCFLDETDFKSVFEFLRYYHGSFAAPNSSSTFGLNFYDGHNATFAVAEAATVRALAGSFNNGSLVDGMSE